MYLFVLENHSHWNVSLAVTEHGKVSGKPYSRLNNEDGADTKTGRSVNEIIKIIKSIYCNAISY